MTNSSLRRNLERFSDRPLNIGTGAMVTDFSALRYELLLFELQSPINIGLILRVAETYQFGVSIFDRHRILQEPEKRDTIRDFACGAVERRGLASVDGLSALAQLRRDRRLIATQSETGASSLPNFRFAPGDIIVLGNEYDGLPDDLTRDTDVVLQIPMPKIWTPKPRARNPIDPKRAAPVARDGNPSLNVAMTAGIVCYAAFAQWLSDRVEGS